MFVYVRVRESHVKIIQWGPERKKRGSERERQAAVNKPLTFFVSSVFVM